MPTSRPVSPELLLSHAGWVRSLARGLLRDPQAAEDVVQATWVAALEHGPREGRPLAAWLGRVARNFARKRMRSEARRGAHETLAARREGEPSAAELYERAALHRELVEAVMGLDEPYRSTILLRYFEDLPPRAIARREGIPVQTVKTRIARALEKLRARLDTRSGGDRTAWIGALAAFTRKPFAVGTGTTALTIMSTNLKLVGAGALVAALVASLFVWKSRSAEEPARSIRGASTSTPGSAQSPLGAAGLAEAEAAEPARTSETQGMRSKSASVAEEPIDPDHDLHGRVTNSSGQPLRGARIEIRSCEVRGFDSMGDASDVAAETLVSATASDGRGEFHVRLPRARPFDLYADLDGYAPCKLPCRYAGEEVRVVLTASFAIFGRVTRKADGAPCVGAVVHAEPHAVSGAVRMNGSPEFRTETDESGSYRLEGLPSDGLLLDVDARDAVKSWGILVQGREGAAVERNIALESGILVTGFVTDAATGLPISGAEVSINGPRSPGTTKTDPDGRYAIRGVETEPGWLESVRADAQGFASRVRMVETASVGSVQLDFQLRAGLAAKGRVLGPDDRPLVGAIVVAFGRGNSEDGGFYERRSLRTGADGTFEFTHLSDGAHHTLFLRKAGCGTKGFDFPLDEASRSPIDFGDLRLPAPATIQGRVLDESGKPVPDTFVGLQGTNSDSLRFSNPESPSFIRHDTRQTGRTDDQGRFGFSDLSAGTYTIRTTGVEGSATSAQCDVVLAEEESRDNLVLVLALGLVLEGRVLDPAGNPVPFANVSLYREDEPRDEMAAHSAFDNSRADGSFHLQGLREGKYSVFVDPSPRVAENSQAELSYKLWRGVSAGSRDLNLVLPAAEWIEGTVLDPKGKPSFGAQIQAQEVGEESSVPYSGNLAHADAHGHFRVKVSASSRVNLLALSAPRASSGGWQPDSVAKSDNVAAGTTDVKLKLAPWH